MFWTDENCVVAGDVTFSSDPVDIDRALTTVAAAMGREPWEGGFRAKARPFQVGDLVRRCTPSVDESDPVDDGEILGGPWDEQGDDVVAVRNLAGSEVELWLTSECRLITPAEEVERGAEEDATEHECGLFLGSVCAECGKVDGSDPLDKLYDLHRSGLLDSGDYEDARDALLTAGRSA